jgi:hypothetical protein
MLDLGLRNLVEIKIVNTFIHVCGLGMEVDDSLKGQRVLR